MDSHDALGEGSQPSTQPENGTPATQAQQEQQARRWISPPQPSADGYQKNWRMTVCSYWMKGLCMRGDACGFLHKLDQQRMPVCREYARTGHCADPTCQFKHTDTDVKECNMYRLGFCVYGSHCRYKHSWAEGPPPAPKIAAAKLAELHRHRTRRQEQVKRDEEREKSREEEQAQQQQQQQVSQPNPAGWSHPPNGSLLGYPTETAGIVDGQYHSHQQQHAPLGQMRGMISGPRPPPGDPSPQSALAATQHGPMQFPSPLIYSESSGAGLPLPFLQQSNLSQITH